MNAQEIYSCAASICLATLLTRCLVSFVSFLCILVLLVECIVYVVAVPLTIIHAYVCIACCHVVKFYRNYIQYGIVVAASTVSGDWIDFVILVWKPGTNETIIILTLTQLLQ